MVMSVIRKFFFRINDGRKRCCLSEKFRKVLAEFQVGTKHRIQDFYLIYFITDYNALYAFYYKIYFV